MNYQKILAISYQWGEGEDKANNNPTNISTTNNTRNSFPSYNEDEPIDLAIARSARRFLTYDRTRATYHLSLDRAPYKLSIGYKYISSPTTAQIPIIRPYPDEKGKIFLCYKSEAAISRMTIAAIDNYFDLGLLNSTFFVRVDRSLLDLCCAAKPQELAQMAAAIAKAETQHTKVEKLAELARIRAQRENAIKNILSIQNRTKQQELNRSLRRIGILAGLPAAIIALSSFNPVAIESKSFTPAFQYLQE